MGLSCDMFSVEKVNGLTGLTGLIGFVLDVKKSLVLTA
jgi:hypothetical protein